MSYKLVDKTFLLRLPPEAGSAVQTLAAMARHAGNDLPHTMWASSKTLANKAHCSAATFFRHVAWLTKHDLITPLHEKRLIRGSVPKAYATRPLRDIGTGGEGWTIEYRLNVEKWDRWHAPEQASKSARLSHGEIRETVRLSHGEPRLSHGETPDTLMVRYESVCENRLADSVTFKKSPPPRTPEEDPYRTPRA